MGARLVSMLGVGALAFVLLTLLPGKGTARWLEEVEDPESHVRTLAVVALGETVAADAPLVVPALARVALEDPDPEVRSSAAASLREVGRYDLTTVVESFAAFDGEPSRRAPLAPLAVFLVELGATAVPEIERVLQAGEGGALDALAYVLADTGDAGVEALLRLLEHPEAKLRLYAVRALGRCGAARDRVVPALRAMADDTDQSVRGYAFKMVGILEQAAGD